MNKMFHHIEVQLSHPPFLLIIIFLFVGFWCLLLFLVISVPCTYLFRCMVVSYPHPASPLPSFQRFTAGCLLVSCGLLSSKLWALLLPAPSHPTRSLQARYGWSAISSMSWPWDQMSVIPPIHLLSPLFGTWYHDTQPVYRLEAFTIWPTVSYLCHH